MKRFFTVLTLAMMCTACSSTETQTTQEAQQTTQEAQQTTQEVQQVTMVDRSGTTFEVPENIERIICTAPSNNEILIALGLGDKLTVVDSYSSSLDGVPDDALVVEFQIADTEALIATESDILIASEHNKGDGEDPYALVSESGTPVVYIPTSVSIEAIYEDIMFLGELTGTTEKAIEIVEDMKARIEYIAEKTANADKKTVYFEISPAPYIYTLGNNTFLDEAIELAGGINVFGKEEGWISPSEEAILTANPEIIITNVNYVENADVEILNRENWGDIDAIINEQVYVVDANASSRASHNVIIAIEEIAKAIHPDLFE